MGKILVETVDGSRSYRERSEIRVLNEKRRTFIRNENYARTFKKLWSNRSKKVYKHGENYQSVILFRPQ